MCDVQCSGDMQHDGSLILGLVTNILFAKIEVSIESRRPLLRPSHLSFIGHYLDTIRNWHDGKVIRERLVSI